MDHCWLRVLHNARIQQKTHPRIADMDSTTPIYVLSCFRKRMESRSCQYEEDGSALLQN